MSCKQSKCKKKDRDIELIPGVEYLPWFVSHEKNCMMNHSGSTSVNEFPSAIKFNS